MPENIPNSVMRKITAAICLVFGHVYYEKVFTGKFILLPTIPDKVRVSQMEYKRLEYCGRCCKYLGKPE
jgi:hypothetical protein